MYHLQSLQRPSTVHQSENILMAWKRANWVQETCLLIQNTVLRAASLYFHRGLRKCFANDYARLFDSPVYTRLDNDVSGHIPAAG